MMPGLLVADSLKAYFFTKRAVVRAVDGVSLEAEDGSVLAVVGSRAPASRRSALPWRA
jgi:ABC-type dipeptide/oligopeptide/nickel transport system ATPase component